MIQTGIAIKIATSAKTINRKKPAKTVVPAEVDMSGLFLSI